MDSSTPDLPSITNSQILFKLMPIEWVMPSNLLILHCSLLLLPSIFPSIRVFSNESALHIRWPKYWSCSFNISRSNEYYIHYIYSYIKDYTCVCVEEIGKILLSCPVMHMDRPLSRNWSHPGKNKTILKIKKKVKIGSRMYCTIWGIYSIFCNNCRWRVTFKII